jgi:chemotaxis response regulator CheB
VSVRLAIVDDAHFVRAGLTRLLVGHERIEVVGAAQTGEELLDNFDKWNPDVITLDLNMPGIGGLGTLDRLRDYRAVPVIILSTHSGEGAPLTIEALGRGAVDFIDKEAYSLVDFGSLRSVLVDKILHVVDGSAEPEAPVDATGHTDPMTRTRTETGPYEMMAIGASTGGPRAIELLLSSLGAGFAVPIVIAQHMPAGFTKAFAERLDRSLPLRVREAVHGDLLEPGTVLIAPGGYQLHVIPSGKRQVAVTPYCRSMRSGVTCGRYSHSRLEQQDTNTEAQQEGEMVQTVLICDDTLFMRFVISNTLTEAGFSVVAEAATGIEAVELYRKHQPDLVTMDIVMPGKGGIDALREIREFDPAARVVMCSAMGQDELIADAGAAGAAGFLIKPFDGPQLLAKINEVMGVSEQVVP